MMFSITIQADQTMSKKPGTGNRKKKEFFSVLVIDIFVFLLKTR